MLVCIGIIGLFYACGKKKLSIRIENYTGQTFYDVRDGVGDNNEWGENVLDVVIPDSDYSDVVMGSYSQKEIDKGFEILVFYQDEEEVGICSYLHIEDGSTLTLYLSNGYLDVSFDGLPEDYDEEQNGEDSVYEGDVYTKLTGEWLVDGLAQSGSFTISADGSWAYSEVSEQTGLFSLVDDTMALYVHGSVQFSLVKQEQ